MNTQTIEILKDKLNNSEAIVIGAGAGLSSSAGFTYSGKRFHQLFHDFEAKYNFHDMYSGGFFPYETQEEFWAYWSRYIFCNRYESAPLPVYEKLFDLVKDKNYFVLTTNVDHCFQRAGFDKQRLFYTQGDYGLFQCSKPCHQATYDNEALVRKMVAEQKNMEIPSELIPLCPKCGRPMTMNLRSDDKFVEDAGWHNAHARYEKFLAENKNEKVLFWELGVGFNTPGIIKYSFWRMTLQNKKAFYACLNKVDSFTPSQIADRALSVNDDIGDVLKVL